MKKLIMIISVLFVLTMSLGSCVVDGYSGGYYGYGYHPHYWGHGYGWHGGYHGYRGYHGGGHYHGGRGHR